MPNFTGVIARARLACTLLALYAAISARRASRSPDAVTWSQAATSRSGCRTGWPYGVSWPVDVEVAAPQLGRVETQARRAATEHVLDHEHPLRPAEAPEGRLRRDVRLRDAAVHPHVRDPVGVVDVAQRAGQHRLGQVEAPPASRGDRALEREQSAVLVEADLPLGVEAVPLAGHGDVLLARQPQPHRPPGDGRAEGRDGGVPVRLHLLAAEPAAHPQALHGHLVALDAEHVGDDLLRLGGVLGAALHEDLAALVDQRQRGVGLQVEVLLAGHLGLAGEDVRGVVEGPLDVAALDGRRAALEAAGRDRLADRHQRRQRLVVDLDRRGPASGSLQRLAEHPDDGVAVRTSPRRGRAARRA